MSWVEKLSGPKFLILALALTMLTAAVGYLSLTAHSSLKEAQSEECAELGGTVYRSVSFPSGGQRLQDSPPPIQINCVSEDGDVLMSFPAAQPH